ncbi:MAG: enoyl-CoA hydratase [Chloroflexi bacterium]|nr:enoyl-CoA hydratase [Chloroflexota bacterium]
MNDASTETVQVEYEISDGVGILTLNNPARRNALSTAVMQALKERLDEISGSREIRVVIIRAEGPVFSSGHDLTELLAGDREDNAAMFGLCTSVMESIRLLPQPVIAQVSGMATAAGCQLVASCDLAVAAKSARFATPGVQIGLFCSTPGVALARAVPRKKAMEMLLTGMPISADEALQFGLVSRVVLDDELEQQTIDLAQQIAKASSHTLSVGKRGFYEQVGLDNPAAYSVAETVMTDNMQAHDAREGIDAFLKKRTPEWQDR